MSHTLSVSPWLARRRKHLLTPVCLAIASSLPMIAHAQEITLREVVVKEQAYSDITTSVQTRAIEESGARDVRTLLQNQTGITVGGGGNAIAQKIYVRGLEDTMLNFTLDGVPQGGNIFHHQGRILIDPNLLKRIDIDKGGTVASVGPGGLAGSVRMTTKDAKDLLRTGQSWGATASLGISANKGHDAGLSFYGKLGEKIDGLFYANRQNNSNYKDGNGMVQPNTRSGQDVMLAKLGVEFAPGQRLGLSYQHLKDEGVRFLRPHMISFGPSNALPVPQFLDQDTITLSYTRDGKGAQPQMDISVFSDVVENQRSNAQALFSKPVGYVYGEKISTSGLNWLMQSKVGGFNVRYGLNHHAKKASALNAVRTGTAGITSQEKSYVSGIFAETTTALSDHWLLATGARYDWYSYTDNHSQHHRSNGLSPNVGLTFLPNEAWSIRAGMSQAIRGVGLIETFLLDNGPGPFIYKNNAVIDKEKSTNAELGVGYSAGAWRFKATAFNLKIDNYINTIFSTTATRGNVGKVQSNGYEIEAAYNQGPWRTSMSVTQSKPKLNGLDLWDGDFSLGVSTGRTWLLNVGYDISNALKLGWTIRSTEKHTYQTGAATTVRTKPGYTVHDVSAHWYPQGSDQLRLSLVARNLLNKQYYDQASYGFNAPQGKIIGYPDPGRNIRIEANWKF